MWVREEQRGCSNEHIFSILFIFIPIYWSRVYSVHVGFEYLFIPFIQEKNCTKHTRLLLKSSFIFMFLCLICWLFFFFLASNCM